MMMTRKNFNKAMAEASRTNKKNTVIAASAAGATGLVTSAIVFVLGYNKNKKISEELDNLKTDIATLDTKVTVTENIIAATTKTAASNDDVKDNVKYVPISIYEYTGAINNKKSIYTKSGSAASVNFTAVANPTINSYNFGIKYYMTESDYNEIFNKTKTEEKTEEKTDKK